MQQIEHMYQKKEGNSIECLLICNPKMVQQMQKSFHEIRDEVARWRGILEVPYQQHLASR